MKTSEPPRPAVLCILDGWGLREDTDSNAIAQGNTPVWDRLMRTCPHAALDTDGVHVGLPAGQMGNSEVGHMNIGAGRVVMQDLPRINAAIADGSLARNSVLQDLIETLRKSGGACHLLGLLSPGGVHSHQDHLAALADIISAAGVPVRIHAFFDGRDTPPKSALEYLAAFEEQINGLPDVAIATVSGRYYAMDRDNRWDRVGLAFAAMVHGRGERASSAGQAIEVSYAADKTDEFILPMALAGYMGMADGDGILMGNFRADRAREILSALLDPAFDGFDRGTMPTLTGGTGLVEYSSAHAAFMTTMFPPENLVNTLGEHAARLGLKQLRIAETEKYAHVTFFLNGGHEDPFEGEERILIPSPKIATYDLKPEMSAPEVTECLVDAIEDGTFDLIIVNFANPDMVGHTGIFIAAVQAVEAVDACVGRLEEAVRDAGGVMLITADHGNVEMLQDLTTGQAHTAHTTLRVPLVLVDGRAGDAGQLTDGRLADVAPTLLGLMNVPVPAEMTGRMLANVEGANDVQTAAE